MKRKLNLFSILIIVFIVTSCTSCDSKSKVNFGQLPFLNEKNEIVAVIEIPAGTNHKYEYDYASNTFNCEVINGKPRVVRFLPYPGNYGFIPGTLMDKERGGDGDALDVLVLSESLPQGSVVPIKPIALLKLMDNGEEDHKVIAVPIDEDLNVIALEAGNVLPDNVKKIIATWFSSYKLRGGMQFVGWANDSIATREVVKWEK